MDMHNSGGLTPEQTERVVAIAMDLAREGGTEQLVEFVQHGLPVDVRDPAGNSSSCSPPTTVTPTPCGP